MRILLHTCCAACTIAPYEQLTGEDHQVVGYFYNPNIHPFIEFRRRMKAQKVLQERMPIPVTYEEQYGLTEFLERVNWRGDGRCADCYRLRLQRTARRAVEEGFDAVSTTLLASEHQDHSLVRRLGADCAGEAGLQFIARDWRPLAEEAHERARRMNLYLQNYCGCIFSEWERFRQTRRHLYRGPGPASDG